MAKKSYSVNFSGTGAGNFAQNFSNKREGAAAISRAVRSGKMTREQGKAARQSSGVGSGK